MSTLKQKLDENLLQDKHIRSLLIDRLTKIKKNKQKFRTPDIILAKMTAKTDLSNKMICVIYNHEFVEQLIAEDGVPPQNIRFIADSEARAEWIYKIYGVISKFVDVSDGDSGIRKAMEDFK